MRREELDGGWGPGGSREGLGPGGGRLSETLSLSEGLPDGVDMHPWLAQGNLRCPLRVSSRDSV